MKKLLSIVCVLFVALSLFGCQKKINTTVNYEDEDQAAVIELEVNKDTTLKSIFDELSKQVSMTYELDNEGYVVSINGKENNEYGHWEITVNDEWLDDVIGKTTIKDGDVCAIKYVSTEENLLGGWQIADVAREDVTDEEKEIFSKAMEVVLGTTYEPVCVLATQVVSGTNYAYLAKATTVSNDPHSNWSIIKIYKDLQGEVSLTSIADVNIMELYTSEESQGNLLGGWNVVDSGKPGSLGSQEAQASFEKAIEGLVGVGYTPVQLLASQVVAGMNYMALAKGRTITAEESLDLYVITWYQDLDGNSTITSIEKLDLLAYLG